uniref:Uncharacterized protein n=1 Tax=Arundo donax TaxID=35708 RepID=A0A0A9FSP5_ARUDO
MESNKPVEQNVCKETNKASSNQGSFRDSNVRMHSKERKNGSQNNDMGTTKGLSKHDANLKSASKKDEASPPARPDLQKLIQNAKGARKYSEKPRCHNFKQVDFSVKRDEALDLANKNDGACPTYADMKMGNKGKCARKFSEKLRYGNSNKVDPLVSSHFDEASSHMPELKPSQPTNLAVTSQKHLIAARKRQREDVESLLPSALISSKKPSLTRPTKKQK